MAEFSRTRRSVHNDAHRGTRLRATRFDIKSLESKKRLDKTNELEDCHFCCCCCCNIPSNGIMENSCKRKREEAYYSTQHATDENAENYDDPQYRFSLKHLKLHGASYHLQYKKQGVLRIIKYEVDACLPEHSEAQPARISTRSKKKKDETTDRPPIAKKQRRNKGSSSFASTSENGDISREIPMSNSQRKNIDQDYAVFFDNCSVVDDYLVLKHDNNVIVYDKCPLKLDHIKSEKSDDDSSDVEVIESQQRRPDTSMKDKALKRSEFRHRIMNILVQPYDEDEYVKLQYDIHVRKASARHLDLRNGREISYSTNIKGKSYLDYHQDLKAMLSKFENDKPKSLILLRGFFFWLQNSVQKESFIPWTDAECLAVKPRHVHRQ